MFGFHNEGKWEEGGEVLDGEGGRFPCSTVHLGSRFWRHLEPGLLRLAQGSLRVISAANLKGLGGGKSAGDGKERMPPREVQVVAIDLGGRMEREGGGGCFQVMLGWLHLSLT